MELIPWLLVEHQEQFLKFPWRTLLADTGTCEICGCWNVFVSWESGQGCQQTYTGFQHGAEISAGFPAVRHAVRDTVHDSSDWYAVSDGWKCRPTAVWMLSAIVWVHQRGGRVRRWRRQRVSSKTNKTEKWFNSWFKLHWRLVSQIWVSFWALLLTITACFVGPGSCRIGWILYLASWHKWL